VIKRISAALIETLPDYGEFGIKLDRSAPIHHSTFSVPERGAREIKNIFRIYGMAKAGHLIVFEVIFPSSPYAGREGPTARMEELVKKFAVPLGSTRGRLRLLLVKEGSPATSATTQQTTPQPHADPSQGSSEYPESPVSKEEIPT
jgi:hypothetical protein